MATTSLDRWIVMSVTLVVGACAHKQASLPPAPAEIIPVIVAPAPIPEPLPEPVAPPVAEAPPAVLPPTIVSSAQTTREYRNDAARHIYQHYSARIYKGKMPPLLKAVGVLEISVDSRGQVIDMVWLRAPRHAPEVMREIEMAIRAVQPYPAPVHLQQVKYTDTWLWHASGQFQLDTLTEGQH